MCPAFRAFGQHPLDSSDMPCKEIVALPGALPDLSGTWTWTGRPTNDRNVIRDGKMSITLEQEGTNLEGALIQINGPYEDPPEIGYVEGWDARISGFIVPGNGSGYNMVQLRRINLDNDFQALFTGNIARNGKQIAGYFVNSAGSGGGWFVMEKESMDPDSLQDISELQVTDATERQSILAMVHDFQKGMVTKDRALLMRLFKEPSTPVTGRDGEDLISQTAEQFVDYIITSDEKIEEKLHDIHISVLQGVALMSCKYEYIEDNIVQGEGIEIWIIRKTNSGWRIETFLWAV